MAKQQSIGEIVLPFLAVFVGIPAVIWLGQKDWTSRPARRRPPRRRRRRQAHVDLGPEYRRSPEYRHLREPLGLYVPAWWHRKPPREPKVCYPTKTDALNAFREVNWRVIDEWGGIDAEGSGGEFDAVNNRYGLKGKDKVRSIGEALWVAMPPGRPFCLDELDLDTLNETDPGREHPVGFRLPNYVEEAILDREQAEYYRQMMGAKRRWQAGRSRTRART